MDIYTDSLSKKEIAQKLGLFAPQSTRINYDALRYFFVHRGVLNALNMTETEYIKRRRRFNAVESSIIHSLLFIKAA